MVKGGMGKSDIRRTYGRDADDGEDGDEESSAYSWGADKKVSKGKPSSYEAPDDEDEDGGKAKKGGKGKKDGGKGKWGAAAWGKGAADKGYGGKDDPWMMWGADPWGKGMDPWGKGMDPWGMAAMWSGYGKGGGKGKGKAVVEEVWEEEQKYPGLQQAMTETMEPIAHLEEKWDKETLIYRMVQYVSKAADQFAKDDRLGQRGSAQQAQALLEEYTQTAMGSIHQGCHEKAWVKEANFGPPLTLVAEQIFKNAKLFSRMLAPLINKYIDDSIFRFREEERIGNAVWETVENSGLPSQYYKKCNQHLLKAYDDCHINAKYGESQAENPNMGMLQDFVKSWMSEFTGRAWDILENGVGAKDEQMNFITQLFQTLCHPDRSCLPHDLLAALDNPPPASWPWVAEASMLIFAELEKPQVPKKRKWAGPPGPW